jgi:ribokinase
MFDPGGIQADTDLSQLIQAGIYLIKPNEHEVKMLTGIEVNDLDSAKQAATNLQNNGVENVLITVGVNGAYLLTKDLQIHIPIPEVQASEVKDETGCGDQTMAALCSLLQDGKSIEDAARLAILAGTLQFNRLGVKPVDKDELLNS